MPRSLLLQPENAERYVNAFLNMQGVVALWPLWEGGAMGTTYRDLGPNRLTMTAQGTFNVRSPGGVAFSGLKSDGTSGYLTTPSNAALDFGDVFSITALIRWDAATGSFRAIFSSGSGGPYLRWDGTNGTLLFIRSQVLNIVAATVNAKVGDTKHVGVTKNGATVKLYLDGLDVTGTVTNSTCVSTAVAKSINADIGAQIGDLRLAMVGLHNRAITAGEMRNLATLALGM
jgi:hypothetical protein